MSKPHVHVSIRWLSPDERGRKCPPSGPNYLATIATNDGEVKNGEWSVRLEGLTFHSERDSQAELSFVVDEAPHHVLKPGLSFSLFEGRWPVAEGKVVSYAAEPTIK